MLIMIIRGMLIILNTHDREQLQKHKLDTAVTWCDGCNGKGWRWHRSQAIDPWTMLPLVFTNYHRLSFSKIITRFNDKWLISVVSANDYLHSLTTIIASFCPQSTTPPIHSSLCTLPGTSTGLKDRKQSSVRNALLMKMMTNKSQVQSFWLCVDRHQLKARPPTV